MTPTDVINLGLDMAGKDSITNIDDTDTTANRARRSYHPLRDAVLRDHFWNFAITRKVLEQNAVAPVSGFVYGYKREADDLVTDETAVTAKCIYRITNPDLWDPLFLSMFSTLLASRYALIFSHDAKFSMALLEQYLLLKNDAQAVDGQEGSILTYSSTALTTDVRND